MTTSHYCVAVLGAGTMGAGIAQVAAMHGWHVHLLDVDLDTAKRGVASIQAQLDKLVTKGKLAREVVEQALRQITPGGPDADLSHANLLIEAIVEDFDIKTRTLRGLLMHECADCIIATNTSSLSVSAIGEAIGQPARTVGMHFFNPAPVMKLVEIVAGKETEPAVVERAHAIAESWGKVVARCADVPGFIVNHVARPYYLEAFRIVEDGIASPDVIDDAMKRIGGFRMGPFELTDLIGQDVNTATSRSVWEQLGKPPLLKPSALQESLVAQGHLGRKTQRGVYRYDVGPPTVAINGAPPSTTLAVSRETAQAVDAFVDTALDNTPPPSTPVERYVFARILVAIISQALHAEARGVASRTDIDTAMRFGVNYPHGPFEWMQRIDPRKVAALLSALNETVDDNRFAIPKNQYAHDTAGKSGS